VVTAFTEETRDRFARQIDDLLRDAMAVEAADHPKMGADGPRWSLHARVDRAVSDYIGTITMGRNSAETLERADPYTYLIVKATLTRRERLHPLAAMMYARPFRPAWEAVEDALIKPLMHEAMDRTLTADDREHRMLAILSDWVPFEDYDTDDEGSPDA
jgi:hypothetical protein